MGCPTFTDHTHCDVHRPKPWASSDRAKRLPSNWTALRRLVLQRDRYTCHVCGGYGDRVDHVVAGDNHDPSNLAPICLPCDRHKSGVEGGRASWGYRTS